MLLFQALTFLNDPVPRPAALNMAVDQALLEMAAGPVLRVYAWDQPSVSFGFSHSWQELRPTLPPWPAVRRWTGGGVVFHEADTTYSLIVPAAEAWSRTRPLESYKLIHASLAALLGRGRLAGEGERLEGPRCFEAPALFDILGADGGKIAGAGQRRGRHGLLHQGSIRLALGDEFWRPWARSIAGEVLEVSAPDAAVLARAEELVAQRYGTAAWLERREAG